MFFFCISFFSFRFGSEASTKLTENLQTICVSIHEFWQQLSSVVLDIHFKVDNTNSIQLTECVVNRIEMAVTAKVKCDRQMLQLGKKSACNKFNIVCMITHHNVFDACDMIQWWLKCVNDVTWIGHTMFCGRFECRLSILIIWYNRIKFNLCVHS